MSIKAKLAFWYLVERCDNRGVWHPDFGLMSYQIGISISREEFLAELADKVVPLASGAFFIPSFVTFQYGELHHENRAHRPVLDFIHKNNLSEHLKGPSKDHQRGIDGPSMEDGRTIDAPAQGAKEKEKDPDKDQEKKKEKEKGPDFLEVWNAHCGGLPKVEVMTMKRLTAWAQRFRANPDLNYWIGLVERLARSDFANGENERGWRADVDFFLRPDTHIKIGEGKYDNRGRSGQGFDWDKFWKETSGGVADGTGNIRIADRAT
jgi:hypothetical protein